jgi:hypothetical protein
LRFHEGLAFAIWDTTNWKFGLIDKCGRRVVGPTYDGVLDSFAGGVARVQIGDSECLIDAHGDIVFKEIRTEVR